MHKHMTKSELGVYKANISPLTITEEENILFEYEPLWNTV